MKRLIAEYSIAELVSIREKILKIRNGIVGKSFPQFLRDMSLKRVNRVFGVSVQVE